MPSVGNSIVYLITGPIFDYVRSRNVMSLSHLRKLFHLVGKSGTFSPLPSSNWSPLLFFSSLPTSRNPHPGHHDVRIEPDRTQSAIFDIAFHHHWFIHDGSDATGRIRHCPDGYGSQLFRDFIWSQLLDRPDTWSLHAVDHSSAHS